jgi:16S rRNA (cytidine1402-2'-O)-methyltransferase
VSEEKGRLFVVATPIGNLGDITLRAIETLKSCDRIAAEDTRHTKKLLTHLGIEGKPLDALHAHSGAREIAKLVEAIERGANVALVTDAGTPIVSDPGEELVATAVRAGIRIVPLPGPSAVLAALAQSGLRSGGGFRFMGFLPRDGTARAERIGAIAETPEAVVVFEAPERVHDTLADLAAAMPERDACVARELTKVHEEAVRGSLSALAEDAREWRGEVVLVLGAWEPKARQETVNDEALDARIDEELGRGAHVKGVAERLAAWSGRKKRDVYERVLARRQASKQE